MPREEIPSVADVAPPELALFDPEIFHNCLKGTIDKLKKWGEKSFDKEITKEESFNQLREEITFGISPLSAPEKLLFNRLLDLTAIKHQVGAANKDLYERSFIYPSGTLIGFLGPLGVSKTTIAKFLRKDLTDDLPINEINEVHEDNIFWPSSQKNKKYMLASQAFFLLANTFFDILAKTKGGYSISDTSTLTDILMWADWYHKTGRFDDEDYQTYLDLVDFLRPIIPKPDLLVVLLPDSLENLKQGVINRASAEGIRLQEEGLIEDLNIEIERVKYLVDQGGFTETGWGDVPILKIIVNPQEIYEQGSACYDCIYQIEEELGLLGHLLDPKPELVATEIMKILAACKESQTIIIHAKSMFTGKTTVLCLLAETVGEEKIIAFQPKQAVRWSEQKDKIVSRDDHSIAAHIIEDNSLNSIFNYINEQGITPEQYRYVLIDEIMLFSQGLERPEEAVTILEKLRSAGFHVIVDGVDYTFQEEPFTFMYLLLKESLRNENWHSFEMATRCRYCEKRAQGTRRYKIGADRTRTIADYGDQTFEAGSEEYEPVCCQEHQSCSNQPEGFVRQELPV